MLDLNMLVYLKWENISIQTRKKGKISKKVKKIIKNISGDLKAGQFLSIIGRSGSGKTTLFNTLCGRLSDSLSMAGGNIIINNSIVQDLTEIRGMVGYVT